MSAVLRRFFITCKQIKRLWGRKAQLLKGDWARGLSWPRITPTLPPLLWQHRLGGWRGKREVLAERWGILQLSFLQKTAPKQQSWLLAAPRSWSQFYHTGVSVPCPGGTGSGRIPDASPGFSSHHSADMPLQGCFLLRWHPAANICWAVPLQSNSATAPHSHDLSFVSFQLVHFRYVLINTHIWKKKKNQYLCLSALYELVSSSKSLPFISIRVFSTLYTSATIVLEQKKHNH